jgi:hypothetical protein
MDVGWNRTAALFAAHDRDTGIIYFTHEYYAGQQAPQMHAHAIRSLGGDWMTGAIDPAAEKAITTQHDGGYVLEEYSQLGLDLVKADNTRESGLLKCYNLMLAGRLKVFVNCKNWLSEFRIYRRKENGQVCKENDHLMDCMRYYIMSGIPISKTKPRNNDWDWSPALPGAGGWMGG